MAQIKDGAKLQEQLANSERAGLAEFMANRITPLDVPKTEEEKDAYATARRYFDAKQFARVAFTLKEQRSAQSRFLYSYSQFLVNFIFSILWVCLIFFRQQRNRH